MPRLLLRETQIAVNTLRVILTKHILQDVKLRLGYAAVVELVDTQDSKFCVLTDVPVRFRLAVPLQRI